MCFPTLLCKTSSLPSSGKLHTPRFFFGRLSLADMFRYRVQKYIHLFGGDPDSVTVLSHSAGAGSIAHHLTASTEDDTVPFQRAILQSPGWEHANSTQIWQDVLTTASMFSGEPIRTGKDLAKLDSDTLSRINAHVVYTSSNGSFTFGPTPDGGYVPDFPEKSLLRGDFNTRPDLMIGHNSNEAGNFMSRNINSEKELVTLLWDVLSKFHASSVEHILGVLYPPPGPSTPYSTHGERAALLVSESSFACNTHFLAAASGNSTLNYRFQVAPSVHGLDLPFTFFHGGKQVPKELAQVMQLYFTNFAKYGSVNFGQVEGLSDWPEYGDESRVRTFGIEGVGTTNDATKNARCDFWQGVEYVR